ncbi:MAG: glycoside hydrolase family 30 beta sandwich domain-containing protein [Ferruginibacter sp.]
MSINSAIPFLLVLLCANTDCKKKTAAPPVINDPEPAGAAVSYWITAADKSKLLQKQTTTVTFGSAAATGLKIEVDSTKSFQTVDGFGYTLTGSSAYLINRLSSAERSGLLKELFSSGDDGIGVSYLRISIGASDLSREVFSYDDLPDGETDPSLSKFSLSKDTVDLIPVLKEVLAVNPGIKIMGSPWSPPVWMKTNNNSVGGSLKPEYYAVYAQYFVKYIQAMKAEGIDLSSVTIQNEPQHGGNNPSMVMSAAEQADFIKNHLGPAFQSAGITTKIIVWDHNCDNPAYPIAVLDDAGAKQFIDGSAFHLYGGDISALSQVHTAHPDKALYFTEQWTSAGGDFGGDLKWHLRNVVIGSMRNWSRIALEWNLANDATYSMHTPGGCTECKGALTINNTVSRNVAYYIIAHASKFVPAGSTVISSNIPSSSLPNVAFKTPAGKKILVVLNDAAAAAGFSIVYKGKNAAVSIPANAVATFTWQ